MRILIEEHHYAPNDLGNVLAGSGINPKHVEKGTRLSLDYVGYYYNPELKDCVFVLPKVVVNEAGKILDDCSAEQLIHLDPQACNEKQAEMLRFVKGFSIWVYRAICVYRDKNPDSDIAINPIISQMGHGRRRERYTFLDVILEILQANRDFSDFITFVVKNRHRGLNKINWTRTISKSQAIIQDGIPIYLNPVNKRKETNYDEELLVIFYSILNHIHEQYGFKVMLNAQFNLIKGERMKQYIGGYGQIRLRQIKYKYFDDRSLRIWELCYAFFDEAYKVAINVERQDYLLVHDFHAVFEDMVDELIGDPGYEEMKKQEDGKRLDHIYRYYGLTDNDDKSDCYYIGDSKYYPRGAKIGDVSIAKQYTYARNLIQYNLDLFLDGKSAASKKYQQYRDDLTEGYDIVPNFFISARADDLSDRGYSDSRITNIKVHDEKSDKDKYFHVSRHFENRLFDRDTILVAHYDVNFLYVLALYARNNQSERSRWQSDVREQFRREIREGLNKEYQFYAMKVHPNEDAEQYFRDNFQLVLGKTYSPFADKQIMSLALDKADPDGTNNALIEELKQHFYLAEFKIGNSPNVCINHVVEKEGSVAHEIKLKKRGVLMVMMENFTTKSNNFLPSGNIAIGIKYTKDSMDIIAHLSEIGYILFHTRKDSNQHLYSVESDISIMDSSEVENSAIYKNVNTADMYVDVHFDNEELNGYQIHPVNKAFIPTTRYDAQFEYIDNLF